MCTTMILIGNYTCSRSINEICTCVWRNTARRNTRVFHQTRVQFLINTSRTVQSPMLITQNNNPALN